MRFAILTATVNDFELDDSISKRVISGDFGKMIGLTVISDLHYTSDVVLSISTRIDLIAFDKNKVMYTAFYSQFLSHFQMESTSTLGSGIYGNSEEVIQKCIDITEAQSYAMALILFKEHGLPVSAMEPTPRNKTLERVRSFLSENYSSQN